MGSIAFILYDIIGAGARDVAVLTGMTDDPGMREIMERAVGPIGLEFIRFVWAADGSAQRDFGIPVDYSGLKSVLNAIF